MADCGHDADLALSTQDASHQHNLLQIMHRKDPKTKRTNIFRVDEIKRTEFTFIIDRLIHKISDHMDSTTVYGGGATYTPF